MWRELPGRGNSSAVSRNRQNLSRQGREECREASTVTPKDPHLLVFMPLRLAGPSDLLRRIQYGEVVKCHFRD